jgi:hypothetical protein
MTKLAAAAIATGKPIKQINTGSLNSPPPTPSKPAMKPVTKPKTDAVAIFLQVKLLLTRGLLNPICRFFSDFFTKNNPFYLSVRT